MKTRQAISCLLLAFALAAHAGTDRSLTGSGDWEQTSPGAQGSDFATPFAVSAWVFTADATPSSNMTIWSSEESGGVYNWMYVDTSGNLNCMSRNGGSTGIATSAGTLSDATWHTCVCVFKAGNSRRAFVDDGSGGSDVTSATVGNATEVYVGTFVTGAALYWDGSLAHLTIWDDDSSIVAESNFLKTLLSGTVPPQASPANIHQYYPMMETGASDDLGDQGPQLLGDWFTVSGSGHGVGDSGPPIWFMD